MNLDVNEAIGMLIPLVAITLGIGMVIVSILAKHRRQMQELDNRHKERMAAIEKGLDLPPDPAAERATTTVRNGGERGFRSSSGGVGSGPGSRYLLRGLVWLGVGLALAVPNGFLGGDRSYGWIAVAVGVAYLIYYAVEGRREGPPPPGNGGAPGSGE